MTPLLRFQNYERFHRPILRFKGSRPIKDSIAPFSASKISNLSKIPSPHPTLQRFQTYKRFHHPNLCFKESRPIKDSIAPASADSRSIKDPSLCLPRLSKILSPQPPLQRFQTYERFHCLILRSKDSRPIKDSIAHSSTSKIPNLSKIPLSQPPLQRFQTYRRFHCSILDTKILDLSKIPSPHPPLQRCLQAGHEGA